MSETPDLSREREQRAPGSGVSVPSVPGSGVSVPSAGGSGVSVPSAEGGPTWKTVAGALMPLALLAAVILVGLPLCPFRMMTGIPCPGCGLTRATQAVLTGDFAYGLRCHPLVFLAAPVVLFAIARATLVSAKLISPERLRVKVPPWAVTTFAVLMLGVYVLRFAGFFGGPSDPVDPAHGLIGRALHLLGVL